MLKVYGYMKCEAVKVKRGLAVWLFKFLLAVLELIQLFFFHAVIWEAAFNQLSGNKLN